MFKKIIFSLLIFVLFSGKTVFASENSYVTIVNPIRGNDFWEGNEKISDAIVGQSEILSKQNVPATWLVRYDALSDKNILGILDNRSKDEIGLLLEITPTLTTDASVVYNKTNNWHSAGSVFLTGYAVEDRVRLIDKSFEKFKSVYGQYPRSVGAWWIDSGSLEYMQKKYGIVSALIVADQYSTDNYQIWGQYFGVPYYPSIGNALLPAQNKENKIPLVMMQWAARDPLNGYGKGVEESTYSVQANDYIDFHNLGTTYFGRLVDIYTEQPQNQFNQLVVGLENSYSWKKYKSEYQNQIDLLVTKQKKGQFAFSTMSSFSNWYQKKFTDVSPQQIIIADDPLITEHKAVWYMNPYYRAGWFYNKEGSVIRDIRQYLEGQKEICLTNKCNEINFATYTTRVLDEVTYGQSWIIDEGRISDFKVSKKDNNFFINYINQSGNPRSIGFLPRDIEVNGKISSIDGAILDVAQNSLQVTKKTLGNFNSLSLKTSIFSILKTSLYFILVFLFFILAPGLVITSRFIKHNFSTITKLFLASIFGLVFYTTVSFVSLWLINSLLLIWLYLIFSIVFFVYQREYKIFSFPHISGFGISIFIIIILGSFFQIIPVFKSGLEFAYGIGFWGPNGHDAIWHISLANEILNGLPPANPILADTPLLQYHYFYDLLLSAFHSTSSISIENLLFRLFPLMFSILLGVGVYSLIVSVLKRSITDKTLKLGVFLSLFFVYFAGSFGWIADYIRKGTLGGESAFWANQSVSLNLNPPFVFSLIMLFGIFHLILFRAKNIFSFVIYAIVVGTLFEVKAYAAILVFLGLGVLFLFNLFKKDFYYLKLGFLSVVLSLLILITNYQSAMQSGSLFSVFIFSPLWFVHTMLEANDRVPWQRIVLMRTVGEQEHNYLKIVIAESIGFFLFIVGNLGMRVFGFIAFIKMNKILNKDILIFGLTILTFSFLIPLFFIQKGTPWNTIQFMYYGLYIMCIPAGLFFGWLIGRLPKILAILIGLIIIVLIPVNSVTTAEGYFYSYPHTFISNNEIAALNFLKKQNDGVVLTFPYDKNLKKKINEPFPIYVYESTAYVSGFGGKPVFVEDILQQEILTTSELDPNDINNYKKRLVDSKTFFNIKDQNWSKEFLKKYNIKYVYLIKDLQTIPLSSEIGLEKIYENKEVVIYKNTK